MANTNETVGERIKYIRRKRGLTQIDLSLLLDVSKNTVSNYERNHTEPDVNALRVIARKLSTTTDFILGLSDNPNRVEENQKFIKHLDENHDQLRDDLFNKIDKLSYDNLTWVDHYVFLIEKTNAYLNKNHTFEKADIERK